MDKAANDDAFLRIAGVARIFDRQTVAVVAASPVDTSVPSLTNRMVVAVAGPARRGIPTAMVSLGRAAGPVGGRSPDHQLMSEDQ